MASARRPLTPVLAALALAGSIAAGTTAPGCKRRVPDVNGIGPYVLGKTRLADARALGRCMPVPSGPEAQCLVAKEVPIGDQPADVQLYFRTTKPDEPLDEIDLEIRMCREKDALAKLVSLLGEPTETLPRRRIWVNGHAFILATFRERGVSCDITFVDPSDTERIAELRAQAPNGGP